MENSKSYWVIGHRISPVPTSGNFDMVVGETPVGVPGPPPHHHTQYTELFMVLEGTMEFMINGEIRMLKEGESIDLPPHTLHTFNNGGSNTLRWLNVHSPKGFSGFFKEYGIDTEEENAFQQSVSDELIGRVVQGAAGFDMHIAQLVEK